MNARSFRIVRYASLLGICILAGFYAGRFFFAPEDGAGSITPQMLMESGRVPTLSDPGLAAPLPDNLPDIRLEDMTGTPHSIHDWSDGPMVINFWATWCAPCLREMPMLERIWQERRDDALTIVGIAIDRLEAVGPYVEQTGVTYPILVGQSAAMEAAESFGADFAGLPFTVFVAPGGRIVGSYSGELHAERLDQILATIDAVAAGALPIDEARTNLAR